VEREILSRKGTVRRKMQWRPSIRTAFWKDGSQVPDHDVPIETMFCVELKLEDESCLRKDEAHNKMRLENSQQCKTDLTRRRKSVVAAMSRLLQRLQGSRHAET
jgi:hypothetical protein